MRRSAVLLAVLFAMLWQTVGLARPGATFNLLADLEHGALHQQQVSHHHHDDGSFHLDDSQASATHGHGDHLTVTSALFPALALPLPPHGSALPGGMLGVRAAEPFLDGLLRPPRAGA